MFKRQERRLTTRVCREINYMPNVHHERGETLDNGIAVAA